MKISRLIWRLIEVFLKYGNCEIDLLIETDELQTEAKLGGVAVYRSKRSGNRVKLLSDGFT